MNSAPLEYQVDFTTERLYDLFGSYGEIIEGEFKWSIGESLSPADIVPMFKLRS